MSLIKALYIVAIGLLIAAFVGFGVETFYPTPKYPEYPIELRTKVNEEPAEESTKEQKEFDQKQKIYQENLSQYNQNSAIILIIIAVALLAASLVGLSKIQIIGDGITLGGVFTLFYGIFRAVSSQEAVFRFIAVGIALVIVVGLTYWRFLKNQKL